MSDAPKTYRRIALPAIPPTRLQANLGCVKNISFWRTRFPTGSSRGRQKEAKLLLLACCSQQGQQPVDRLSLARVDRLISSSTTGPSPRLATVARTAATVAGVA